MSYKEYASKDWVKENTIPSPVEAVPATNESAKVLVEENGVIKRVPKGRLDASYELIYSGEIQCSPATVEVDDMEVTGNICELPFSIDKACYLTIVWDGVVYDDSPQVVYKPQVYPPDDEGGVWYELGNDGYFLYGDETLTEGCAPIGIYQVGETFYIFAVDTNPHTFSVYMSTDAMNKYEFVNFKLQKYAEDRNQSYIDDLDYDSFVEFVNYLHFYRPAVQSWDYYHIIQEDEGEWGVDWTSEKLVPSSTETKLIIENMAIYADKETKSVIVSRHTKKTYSWATAYTEENLLG